MNRDPLRRLTSQVVSKLKNIDIPEFSYLKKWTFLGILIGIVAGAGSLIFLLAIQFFSYIFLGLVGGYYPPLTGGEQMGALDISHLNDPARNTSEAFPARPWIIPFITGGGGLIVGFIIYRFAPEAEGHGTDTAIDAFHHKKGIIRYRVPIVKTIASALTIGTGGSGGREGPTALISAGFGSIIARYFRLSVPDRRIAVAAGIGAGIGSIFRAPLGGALFGIEVLYKRDFEARALLPSLIASVIGYSILAHFVGWIPIFSISEDLVKYVNPLSLIAYGFLGLICGAVSIIYVRSFYAVQGFFRNLKRIPNYFKPAIGGVLVGIIAIWAPEVLGTGYGWAQTLLDHNGDILLQSVWILFALIFLKILATSLTIGSGGSAGVFGPGILIGGFTGAFTISLLHSFGLFTWIDVSSGVIVGMVALFSAASKAPISVIIMGSEMTGGYVLLPAMMLSTFIAYVVSGFENTIYRSQVSTRAESPASKDLH
jgi:CIC family chloride channel protein